MRVRQVWPRFYPTLDGGGDSDGEKVFQRNCVEESCQDWCVKVREGKSGFSRMYFVTISALVILLTHPQSSMALTNKGECLNVLWSLIFRSLNDLQIWKRSFLSLFYRFEILAHREMRLREFYAFWGEVEIRSQRKLRSCKMYIPEARSVFYWRICWDIIRFREKLENILKKFN